MTPATGHGRAARVLIVDDEENIRRLLDLTLKRLSGYSITVDTAGTAEDARRLLDQNKYHLLISDYRMPGRTGVDLLQYAHTASPGTARMLITAYAQMDIGVQAVNRGRVDGFVRKPWDSKQLTALVESLLEPRVGGPAAAANGAGASNGATNGASNGQARAPAASAPMQVPPIPASSRPEQSGMEAEIETLNKQLRQLRVRLGLGGISPEGFQRANQQLTQRKATLEVELMKMRGVE